jgi:hypothetical protein
VVLLIAILLLTTVPGIVSADGELYIPIDKRVQMSNNLSVELKYVTVSETSYSGAYSSDPAGSVWPILVFKYENDGNIPLPGRLHVKFIDNESKAYEKVSQSVEMIVSGKTYAPDMIEVAMPRHKYLTELVIVDDSLDHKKVEREITIPLTLPSPTPTPTAVPLLPEVGEDGGNWLTLAAIPVFVGIVALIGWVMARKII